SQRCRCGWRRGRPSSPWWSRSWRASSRASTRRSRPAVSIRWKGSRRSDMALIELRRIFKSYFLHGKRIDVLRDVSLDIEKGELVSLIGPSGAGKSTFLHVLGTLDAPAAGTMTFDGRSVFTMNDAELAELRNRSIGFVFQSHFLLPEFTAVENVAMPAL